MSLFGLHGRFAGSQVLAFTVFHLYIRISSPLLLPYPQLRRPISQAIQDIKAITMNPVKQLLSFVFPFLILLNSCTTTANFDQYAYAQTTAVKVEALDLMSDATQDDSLFTAQIKDVDLKLQKIYEYEKNRPKNDITVKMWQLLLDPN